MGTSVASIRSIVKIRAEKKESFRQYIDSKKNYFFFKRVFDLVFSLVVTVFILSWLIPLLSIFIKLESPGPVFFIQKRVGRGGRIFRCLKFRSMVVNSEANHCQAMPHDYRITKVGKFLRASNLDEFPQFLNVLWGDMSIVGPRPHMLADCNSFSAVVSQYKLRSFVKPGITGLAQSKGYRGPAKDNWTIFRRYQYDCFYIRNLNFLLDLRIIYVTFQQTRDVILHKLIKFPVLDTTITPISVPETISAKS